MKSDNNIKFVASRYRKGAFSTEKAWRRMGLVSQSWWSRSKIAAAVAAIVFMSATAAIIVHRYYLPDSPAAETVIVQEESQTKVIKVINFDNADLTTVVTEIKKVYGVEVVNLPEGAASCHLTLHYEGNVCDLIERINEILDTNLEIRKCDDL